MNEMIDQSSAREFIVFHVWLYSERNFYGCIILQSSRNQWLHLVIC